MIVSITTKEELETELKDEKNKDKLVIIDFYATWCGPCVRIAPKIEEWSSNDDFKDTVVFLKCDVDQAEEFSEEYKIDSMPTFVFLKDGKEVHRVVGANVDQLKKDIESNLK